ncbi:NYN domain-containing protein [Metallumcola ferriviriculae]|uniref:NYN domain-containing protein n=1 Tax=Metallumcola ferriviriculae TaxID=3039180 RepID=A0AAU0UMG7_9FIRM|nr:NYN domain-containing protein [Desulfitibacteraceae bacterium MK1]
MEDILIVDGYNVISAWPELIALKNTSYAHARDKLLQILSDYRGFTGIEIVVVFDAHLVKGGIQRGETLAGIQVIFSGEGETADMIIEKLVDQLPGEMAIAVATSDWAEQRLVMQRGAMRLSARDLLRKVTHAKQNSQKYFINKKNDKAALDLRLAENVRKTLEKWRRGK